MKLSTPLASMIVVLVASLMGCGNPAGDETNSRPEITPDASILAAGGDVNAFLAATPAEWLEKSGGSVALTGTVVGVEDGFSAIDFSMEKNYFDTAERTAVIKIKATEVFAGQATLSEDEYAYVSLSRGLEVVDEKGEVEDPSTSMVTPLPAFVEALPVGTRVVVIAGPERLRSTDSVKVVDAGKGLPDDATLLSGLHPQSFSLVINDDWVTGWDLSHEQIVDSLRSAR